MALPVQIPREIFQLPFLNRRMPIETHPTEDPIDPLGSKGLVFKQKKEWVFGLVQ